MNNLIKKKKVLAYITNGNKLLVFEEPDYPEVGIQIPGGTVEANESPEQAIIREIKEETGIEKFNSIFYLGYAEKNMTEFGKNEIHQRYFYWLTTKEKSQEVWYNIEKFNDNQTGEVLFKLYWFDLANKNKPDLACDQSCYLYLLENYYSFD